MNNIIYIDQNIVRNKGIDLEKKVRNYRLHPNKYKRSSIEISKIIEYQNERIVTFSYMKNKFVSFDIIEYQNERITNKFVSAAHMKYLY